MAKVHVLGIAAKRFKGRAFGEQNSYLRGLVRIARRMRMRAYVFSPLDIDPSRRRVRAWVWTRQGWRKAWQPLPTVVHDRMWGLDPQARERYEQALAVLRDELGIPVFNPDFGTKYDVHQTLAAKAELKPHIPETHPFAPDALWELSLRYPSLYIKPARGRQGKGIYRLVRRGQSYYVTYRVGKVGAQTKKFSSYEGALAVLSRAARQDPYIVQQGLNLVRLRGGTVDVRAIVQRDGTGAWRVSAVGCRIGPPGGFVSNLHAGGRAVGLPALLRRLPKKANPKTLRRRIETLALTTAEALGEVYPTLGEIGLDVGIDRDGRLWILEVNRQPGRSLFARARLRKAWMLTRRRVVLYALFLSRQHRPLQAAVTPSSALAAGKEDSVPVSSHSPSPYDAKDR